MSMLVRGAALVLLPSLSACGGGGGDSTPPPPPSQRGALDFASAQSNAAENGGTVNIAVSRASGSEGEVSATVTITGTATSGTDFTAPTTVTFANGATTANISVAITNDPDPEVDETVTLTLSAPAGGATLGTATAYTLTIQSDDAPAAPAATIAANTKQLTLLLGSGTHGDAVSPARESEWTCGVCACDAGHHEWHQRDASDRGSPT